VFFRAKEWEDAMKVLEGMFSLSFVGGSSQFTLLMMFSSLFVALSIILFTKNSSYYLRKKITTKHMVAAAILFAYAISKSLGSSSEVFLYYNF